MCALAGSGACAHRYPMKYLAALALLAITSCTEKQSVKDPVDTAIFDDFRAVADAGAFENLARRIHPEILKTFRRRLEFTTSSPLEGS